MRRPWLITIALVMVGGWVTGTIAQAQPQASPERRDSQATTRSDSRLAEQAREREKVAIMESVLARKVEGAAAGLSRRLQAEGPTVLLLDSRARVRGFRLDAYGFFFDVDVPTFSRSLAWTFQLMGPPDQAVKSLREHVQSISDPRTKRDLELAIERLELQLPKVERAAGSGGQPSQAEDPNDAYTREVTLSLMDAMLDFGHTMQLGSDEWLTVAARDSGAPTGFAPDEPYDLVTVQLRVRGSDLKALSEGRITREEARKRIERKEF